MSRGSSIPESPESTAAPHRRGLSSRGERWLDVGGSGVVFLLAAAWVWAIANARNLSAAQAESGGSLAATRVATAFARADGPKAAYLTDAALNALTAHILDKQRGASGKLRATIQPAPTPLSADSL